MKSLGLGWVLWAFNAISESRDFLEALNKALPCRYQLKKGTNVVNLTNHLFKHWHRLDGQAAVSEIILNAIEDKVIGRGNAIMGMGGDQSWQQYHNMHIAKEGPSGDLAKITNDGLDALAKSLGLKRVSC